MIHLKQQIGKNQNLPNESPINDVQLMVITFYGMGIITEFKGISLRQSSAKLTKLKDLPESITD